MKKYVVSSIDEYIKIINDISKNESALWFRGQANADHQLTPSLLRQKKEIPPKNESEILLRKYTKEVEYITPSFRYALNEFKRKGCNFLNITPKNDFQWMFIMQHYGVPTRLLDWTTNALVALYFSLLEASSYNNFSVEDESECIAKFKETGYSVGGSAIYVINPITINSRSQNIDSVIDISEGADNWSHYLHPDNTHASNFPICISAPHIDKRIRSQSGMFTLHGYKIEPLDWYATLSESMYKIFIPSSSWINIFKDMKKLGISSSFIFPDLDGIAREIKEDMINKFTDNSM